MSVSNFLTGKPIKIAEGIHLRVPSVREIVDLESYGTHTFMFTVRTREIFSASENVDMLEKKFPTLFEIIQDESANIQLGKYFQSDTVSEALIEALDYWIIFDNLPNDYDPKGENGFVKLSNGKIIHGQSEWVIDKDEYFRVANIIKEMTCYKPNDDLIAPKITSKSQYEAWMSLYKGKLQKLKRNALTIVDKILILSISTGAFIPVDQILDMTVYTFNKVFSGLSAKESFKTDFLTRLSPNYKVQGQLKHWQEKWKRL